MFAVISTTEASQIVVPQATKEWKCLERQDMVQGQDPETVVFALNPTSGNRPSVRLK